MTLKGIFSYTNSLQIGIGYLVNGPIYMNQSAPYDTPLFIMNRSDVSMINFEFRKHNPHRQQLRLRLRHFGVNLSALIKC